MKRNSSGALLYISDIGNEDVDVFSYPSGKLVGTLTGFNEPNGLCADARGDVFVTDTYAAKVVEYAHGGTKPIAKFGTGGTPVGCAIDPTSGDLAVTFFTGVNSSGYFEIFTEAKGPGVYYPGLYRTFYCTYDGSGNLFIDGFNNGGGVSMAELAKGGSKITEINVNGGVGWSGGLQWDGKHVALGDQIADKFVPSRPYVNAVYKLSVVSNQATPIRTAPLDGSGDVVQFWLQSNTIIGPDARNGDVDYFSYPKGGKASKTISGFYEPAGAAVSQ